MDKVMNEKREEEKAGCVCGVHISYFSVEEWTLITSNVIYQRERERH